MTDATLETPFVRTSGAGQLLCGKTERATRAVHPSCLFMAVGTWRPWNAPRKGNGYTSPDAGGKTSCVLFA